MRNATAVHLAAPVPIVPNASIAKLAAPAVFVKKENLPTVLMAPPIKKAVPLQRVNAGQKQKKEQDVPVIKGLAAIAGSMAVEPWNCITTIPLL